MVNSLEETLQYFRTVEIGEEINTLAYFCAPAKVCCRNKLTLNQTEQPHRTDRKTARQAADIDSNQKGGERRGVGLGRVTETASECLRRLLCKFVAKAAAIRQWLRP